MFLADTARGSNRLVPDDKSDGHLFEDPSPAPTERDNAKSCS
jgi:hypothetical protein